VNADHRARSEGAAFPATCPQEIPVEVVDVGGVQLGQVEVAEVRPEVAVDDGAGVAHGGGRPAGRCGLEPLVEQIRERAGPDAGAATSSSNWLRAKRWVPWTVLLSHRGRPVPGSVPR
jgi:hypothetical protein